MKIAVLTDSSAYLTKEQQEKYQIDVLPIPIIWGKKVYHDLVDIGYEEFYQKLNTAKELPTTSQPSIGDLKEKINEYVEQGYTDVIFQRFKVLLQRKIVSRFIHLIVRLLVQVKQIMPC